ncbi:MAG: peptidoglycan editing factor PgeF [Myxococcaceae bacterium]|nr:peptidoglycan editing factor PgeF [Myxococcaceae bacterium]
MASPHLTSCLLPARHAFSVREGGVSEGPFASLNLGFATGDVRARVNENLRRFASALNVPPGSLITVSQVHGDRLLEATAPQDGDEVPPPLGEADGVWTRTAGLAVGVKTADCVPILISDAAGRCVAAVHSGWRGTDLRISARAVETLAVQGVEPASLVAAIGPCIGACCYEVSEELAFRFERAFGAEVVRRDRPKPHLDLPRAVRLTLVAAGVRPDRIDVLDACTACDPARFFSHRRDRGISGRHLSAIVAGK